MTVLFGGTFDPVHNGHVTAVRALMRELEDITRVIIMPAFVNPFKAGLDQGASPENRLEMCQIAFGDIEKCVVSDYEIRQSGTSYTYNTLMYLREAYPDEQLVLALGGDSLATLDKWYRAQDILNIALIAAVRRDNENPVDGYAERLRALGGTVRIIRSEPFVISSTQVRQMLSDGRPVQGVIPGKVAGFIAEKGLYNVQH